MSDAVSSLPSMLPTHAMTRQARRITESASNEPRWVQWLMMFGAVLFCWRFAAAAGAGVCRGVAWRLGDLPARSGRPGRVVGDQADLAGDGDRAAIESDIRRGRCVGHQQAPVLGQTSAGQPDRPAVFGVAAGLIFVLIFGRSGWAWPLIDEGWHVQLPALGECDPAAADRVRVAASCWRPRS